MADEIVRRMQTEIDELQALEAPELWEWTRRNTRESQRIEASHVRSGLTLPRSCPQPDAEAARIAAGVGMSLSNTLRAFRFGTAECRRDPRPGRNNDLRRPGSTTT